MIEIIALIFIIIFVAYFLVRRRSGSQGYVSSGPAVIQGMGHDPFLSKLKRAGDKCLGAFRR